MDGLYSYRYQTISVDINQTLVDGSPNPNVGRPFLTGRSTGASRGGWTKRDSLPITAFGELRSEDFFQKSLLTRIVGHHVITGLYGSDRYDQDRRSWARFLLDPGWGQVSQGTSSLSPRTLQIYQYLGPDLRNATKPANLHLQSPTALLNPTSTSVRFFDSHWKQPTQPGTTGYVIPADPWVDPFNGATREAINWQGYRFNDTVIPLLGFRRDTNKVYNTNAAVGSTGIADTSAATYNLTTPRAILKTEIKSGRLVLYLPKSLHDKMPWGTNLSLTYNRSSNFNPSDVGRVDMFARPLAPSKGDSRDYGFVISTLNDRFILRVNWFKTSVRGATFNWGGPLGWVFNEETRGYYYAKRYQAGLTGDPAYSGTGYNYGVNTGGVFVQTDADRAKQAADVAAVLGGVPKEIFTAAGLPNPPDTMWGPGGSNSFGGQFGSIPTGYTATRDTVSEGTEFELTFNPTKNWTIFANASKTEARTSNNVGDLVAWLNPRTAFWNAPAGDLRFGSGGPASMSIRTDWNNNVGYPYALQQYTNGANVQELAKWRYNIARNYTFSCGIIKGVKIGGSYRWIAHSATGYPWTYLTIDGTRVEAPNVHRPVYGPSDHSIDFWIGYKRKLSAKIAWEIQLILRNAFGHKYNYPHQRTARRKLRLLPY